MAATTVDLGIVSNTTTEPNGDFIITGGGGDHTLTLGSVSQGFGNRRITLGNGNNTLTLNGGTDQVTAGTGDNIITATGPGADVITLSDGANTVTVGDGPDVIVAGNGANTITTGLGSSQITIGNGADTVTTGGGNNTVSVTLPTTPPVTADTIQGALTTGNGTGNTLVLATAGTFDASLVSGFQTYQLANGGPNTLGLVDANFVDLLGATPTITVDGGDSGSTLDASGVSTGHNILVHAGTGMSNLIGGSGTNTAIFAGPQSNYIVTRDPITGIVQFVQSVAGQPNTSDAFTNLWNVAFTEAPPTALALTPPSDSGSSNTDDITNVVRPTITGAGNNGDTVTLLDGSSVIGTGTVAGGVWSVLVTPLNEGSNAITATQIGVASNVSAPSAALTVTLDTTALPPANLAVSGNANSSGTLPTISGTGEDGAIVTLLDGSTTIGTGAVTGGVWSIAATAPLAQGPNAITATQTDVAGNISAASAMLTVTPNVNPPVVPPVTSPPVVPPVSSPSIVPPVVSLPNVTAALVPNSLDARSNGIVFSQVVAGGGDPNAAVTISEGGNPIATSQADSTGAWGFDPSILAQGSHILVGKETDTSGKTGSTFPLTSPNQRFHATDVTTSTSGSVDGSDYAGPVSYLQAQYAYTGLDNVVISANVANVFIHGGSAIEALAAKAGSNVLEGGTSSNWLVGASGADGGNDTFFVDNRDGQSTWDTLLNFHTGDSLTLWGFNAASGTTKWMDNQGTAGHQGATLLATLGNGTAASANITFAGLSSAGAQFATGTGTANGIDYLSITRVA